MKALPQWSNRYQILRDESLLLPSSDCILNTFVKIKEKSESSNPIKDIAKIPPTSPESTLDSPLTLPISVSPSKIYLRSLKVKVSIQITVQLQILDTGSKLTVTALLDSGATGMFLDKKFVLANNLNTRRLPRAIPVYNVDGTLNQGGSISEEVELMMNYQNHTERAVFAVCDLGDKPAIIGHTWLFRHNPEIDWQTGQVTFSRCPPRCLSYDKKEHVQQKKSTSYVGKKKRLTSSILHAHLEEVEDIPDGIFDSLGSSFSPTKDEGCSLDVASEFFSCHGFSSTDDGESITCDFDQGDRLFVTAVGKSMHVKAVATPSQ